ncbi:MAG: TRAP transporter large permease subunit [Fervidicoccaceae archaeon]
MSPLLAGFLAYAVLTILLLLGMPVAFALGVTSLLFALVFVGYAELNMLAVRLFEALNDFSYLAIPMFVLLGAVVARTRAGEDFYEATKRLLKRLPGSLGLSTIATSTAFAALTGVSAAATAAVGKIAIPQMLKRGYHPRIAAGSVVAGGTLGILIPPSITMIVYGIATDTSIGKLFLGGVIPGLALAGLYAATTCLYHVYLDRRARGADSSSVGRESLDERGDPQSTTKLLLRTVPFIAIIVFILGSIYAGVASPNEAGALGALFALLIATALYRPRLSDYFKMLDDTVKESVFLLFLIAMSFLYGIVLTRLHFSQEFAELIARAGLAKWQLVLVVNLFLFLLGMFLPPVSIIVITTPILQPVVTAAGIDPIWYGVMLTINLEAGLITPPVGLNLFVVKGIAPDISFSDILKGGLVYLLCIAIMLILIYFFPGLVLWLPSRMMR